MITGPSVCSPRENQFSISGYAYPFALKRTKKITVLPRVVKLTKSKGSDDVRPVRCHWSPPPSHSTSRQKSMRNILCIVSNNNDIDGIFCRRIRCPLHHWCFPLPNEWHWYLISPIWYSRKMTVLECKFSTVSMIISHWDCEFRVVFNCRVEMRTCLPASSRQSTTRIGCNVCICAYRELEPLCVECEQCDRWSSYNNERRWWLWWYLVLKKTHAKWEHWKEISALFSRRKGRSFYWE